jgi:hypothetical protein
MPRQRSYETEKRYRTARLNRRLRDLKRLATNENSYTVHPPPKEMRRMVEEHDDSVKLTLAAFWAALVDLNYLEWEASGAVADD